MYSFAPGTSEPEGKANFAQLPESPLRTSATLSTLLTQFRSRYPTASLVAELLMIHDSSFVVRALVQMGGITLVSGMASAPDIELAEDRAKVRALEALALQPTPLPKSPSSGSAYELQVKLTPPELPAIGSSPAATEAAAPPALPSLEPPLESAIAPIATLAEPEPDLADLTPPIDPEPAVKPKAQRQLADLKPLPDPIEPLPELEPPPVSPEPEPEPVPALGSTAIDLSDAIAQTTVELKRLGWSNARGRDHLEQTYGKRSRQQLTDAELLDFLHYLQAQASPATQTPF